ncbi:MAG TPA: hypothetical protein VGO64_05600 [Candidatus Limnocylindrales bacterium]|nr:hypothetical protein [Candidatus Limnocylindrales bacterium]
MIDRPAPPSRRLRIVHLFPDLLSVYGDAGNVRTLVARASWRGIEVDVATVVGDSPSVPEADVLVIGGGQDRDQAQVERALRRLGDPILAAVADGAALLAVCGGYQSLGIEYRTREGLSIRGPGILDVRTVAGQDRLVGPVVAKIALPDVDAARPTIVGFENHSGRTTLGESSTPFAFVEVGHGNNDEDGTEGLIEQPGVRGLRGLRIGTYLHGPFLPRNPHVADLLIAAGLRRTGQGDVLEPLDDQAEWAAHDRFVAVTRRRPWMARLPSRIQRATNPARNLIGF